NVRCSPYTQRPDGVYPLWNDPCVEFERAVLDCDADWFRRQADAIEKGGLPQRRAQFNALVVYLFESAMCETLGRRENWSHLTDVEREAFPNLPPRVPQVVTLTPAGKFTDATASDIWREVVRDMQKEQPALIEQELAAAESYLAWSGKPKRQIIEQVIA